ARRWWLRWAFLAAVPLTAFAVVSTYSRGGFLGLVAAGVAYLALQRRRILGLTVGVLIVIPVWMFMSSQEGYLDRLSTIDATNETGLAADDPAEGRLHFWKVAAVMARDSPLGVGLFNFERAYDRFDDLNGEYGHNRSVHSSHF